MSAQPELATPPLRDDSPGAGLSRRLYRESAITFYEQGGGEYRGRRTSRSRPMSGWQRFGAPFSAAACVLGTVVLVATIRVPVPGPVPLLLSAAEPGRGIRGIVAVLPAAAADLVRSGTILRLTPPAGTSGNCGQVVPDAGGGTPADPAADRSVRVFVSGTGTVLTATSVRGRFPLLAGRSLPAEVVVGTGVVPSAPVCGFGPGPLGITARGPVGERPWLVPDELLKGMRP